MHVSRRTLNYKWMFIDNKLRNGRQLLSLYRTQCIHPPTESSPNAGDDAEPEVPVANPPPNTSHQALAYIDGLLLSAFKLKLQHISPSYKMS